MIAITGATGQTGSKVAELLLSRGVKIRVIGRSAEKLEKFSKRGAEAAVGDQRDTQFLTEALSGCEAAYLLIPPKMDTIDFRVYYNKMGDVAVKAISGSGCKKVVFLSSLGAELESGTGPVVGLHDVELKLKALVQVDVMLLRPGYFMENTLWNIPLIKNKRINGTSTPPDAPVTMIATGDIAKKAAELLTTSPFSGHEVLDLFGERLTYAEATGKIGKAIGIPELPYVQFTDSDTVNIMMAMGVSKNMAESMVELSSAIGKGLVHPTYIDPLKPNTDTSFTTFSKEVFEPEYRNHV